MTAVVAITGMGEAVAGPEDSLETMIFRGAREALEEAGVTRGDLDGVVLAASDQTDGRAIASMLSAGPAGAYLNDEINTASSPGHALALGYMQILSGTHARLLISSWGKASETAGSVQAAERLSADPFFERDGGLSSVAAAALQAQAHRAAFGERAAQAAARVASRNHGDVDEAAITRSAVVASPLRELELPPETDGSFSIVLQRADDVAASVALAGVGWCTDSGRIAERDLVGVPHLERAARDAYSRAGVGSPSDIGSWHLHDYTPDAEILAYGALGLCERGGAIDLALSDDLGVDGRLPVNPGGGSVAGEAPFGGPMRKVLEAVRQVRGTAARSIPGVERALAQMSTGYAGQFQSVAIVERVG